MACERSLQGPHRLGAHGRCALLRYLARGLGTHRNVAVQRPRSSGGCSTLITSCITPITRLSDGLSMAYWRYRPSGIRCRRRHYPREIWLRSLHSRLVTDATRPATPNTLRRWVSVRMVTDDGTFLSRCKAIVCRRRRCGDLTGSIVVAAHRV